METIGLIVIGIWIICKFLNGNTNTKNEFNTYQKYKTFEKIRKGEK